MSKAKQAFLVYIQGWGDNEDTFYNVGTFSTHAKAAEALEQMIVQYQADGGEREHVIHKIEQAVLNVA